MISDSGNSVLRIKGILGAKSYSGNRMRERRAGEGRGGGERITWWSVVGCQREEYQVGILCVGRRYMRVFPWPCWPRREYEKPD